VFLLDRALATWRGKFTFKQGMRRCPRARSRLGRGGAAGGFPFGASTRRCSGRGSKKTAPPGGALGRTGPGQGGRAGAERAGGPDLRRHRRHQDGRGAAARRTRRGDGAAPLSAHRAGPPGVRRRGGIPPLPRSRRRRSLLRNRHPRPRLRRTRVAQGQRSLRRPPPLRLGRAPAGDESAPPARPPAAAPKAAAPVLSRPRPPSRRTRERVAGRRADRLSALWSGWPKADHFEVLGLDRRPPPRRRRSGTSSCSRKSFIPTR